MSNEVNLMEGIESLDPSEVYTPMDVERLIADVTARITRGALYQQCCEEEANATNIAFTLAYNKAFTSAARRGSGARAFAMRACEAEYVAKETAATKVKTVRSAMQSLRALLMGYQSVSKSVISTFNVSQ